MDIKSMHTEERTVKEMTPRILFTDMDDTLLNTEKSVTKENMDAIHLALAKGHKIAFNTGRPLAGFLPLIRELGLEQEGCYAIAFNGGLIYDCGTKQTIFRQTIPLPVVREVFRRTKDAGLYCHTYSDTSILCQKATKETAFYTATIHIPVEEHQNLPDLLSEPPCKMIVISLDGKEKLEKYRLENETWAKGKLSLFYSNDWFLEHVPEHVSKGNAVIRLADLLRIPLSNTIAAGDQENDISMIQKAGRGCAMANAIPSVKLAADYITQNDCNHSGVAEIIHKFIL